jgi:hypothetical protein
VLSVATFSLCYPNNEEVPQLRRQFVGMGTSKARKGVLEKERLQDKVLFAWIPV